MHPQFGNGYSTDIQIQINPKIRIRIRITFVSNFGVGKGLHSLLQTEHLYLARYRTSDLTDFQNAVACKGYLYQCSIKNDISDICCFRGVILSPYNCS